MSRGLDRLRRPIAVLVALAVMGAACGTTDGEGSSGDPARPPDIVEAGGDVTEPRDDADRSERSPEESTTVPAGSVMFGDLPMPCGPGDASGATDQGVTDTEIRVASGDDRGSASAPGLNHEQSDAMEALVAYCNELGGIGGRRIVLDLKDAALVDVDYVMDEACDQDFMLVGHGFRLDGRAEPIRVACGLPAIPAWTADAAASHGPDMYQPVPDPADRLAVHAAVWLAENHPGVIERSAIVYEPNTRSVRAKEKILAAYSQLGHPFALSFGLGSDPTDEAADIVTALAEAGIEHVHYIGDCATYRALREAAGNELVARYTASTDLYRDDCAATNRDGVLDDTFISLAFVPFEEADGNRASAEYLRIVVDHGGDVSLAGAQTASAFLLWATAAAACGSALTRRCVLDEIAEIEEWTAGGLHAPTTPGANVPPDCGVVVGLVATEFVRVSPAAPGRFACGDAYRVEISTDATRNADLDEHRISRAHTAER